MNRSLFVNSIIAFLLCIYRFSDLLRRELAVIFGNAVLHCQQASILQARKEIQ